MIDAPDFVSSALCAAYYAIRRGISAIDECEVFPSQLHSCLMIHPPLISSNSAGFIPGTYLASKFTLYGQKGR
jgi:hypothetical protein